VIYPNGEQKMEIITVTTIDSPLVQMKDIDGNPISLPENGILMTRKLCKTLGIDKGDSIQIKRTGEDYVPVQIVQVAYMASGQGIYAADSYWKSLGEKFSPTALLIQWNGPPDQRFLQSDAVMGASLAFVVLYNTGILNFVERIRDLSTLRVLGFHNREIRNLVLVENYFSILIGTISGIPVGRFISWLIASSLDERMDLLGNITLSNVLIATAMTICFAWITNSIIARKMKQLEMLEALKSVE
jgi:putative ABC transport system permease protein